MQSNCISCTVVTGSVIIVALSMTAAILFGLYVDNEKQVFKEMMDRRLNEKSVYYNHTQLLNDYLACKKEQKWDDVRKNVNHQCKMQAKCDIEELVKCRERLEKVKTSVSEFKDNEKPCEGVFCTILSTVYGVVKDATD